MEYVERKRWVFLGLPFTFTKYHGYDPEVSASSSALSRGVDMGNYPQARMFSFGLNVEF